MTLARDEEKTKVSHWAGLFGMYILDSVAKELKVHPSGIRKLACCLTSAITNDQHPNCNLVTKMINISLIYAFFFKYPRKLRD